MRSVPAPAAPATTGLARCAIDHRLNDLELLGIRQRVRLAGTAGGHQHNPLAGASFHQESGVGLETVQVQTAVTVERRRGDALKKGGNKDYTIKLMPGLNHLFQDAKTGSPKEYAQIEETFSPAALKVIGDWIEEKVSQK